VEPALHLTRRTGDRWIGVIGEQPDERGKRAAAGVAGPVEFEHPLDDAAHRLALGVCCSPEHAGEQLLCLTLPKLVVRLTSGTAAGKHLGGGHRPGQSSGGTQRRPGRSVHAANPRRVEHLDLPRVRPPSQRGPHEIGLYRRDDGRSRPGLDAGDQTRGLTRLARPEDADSTSNTPSAPMYVGLCR